MPPVNVVGYEGLYKVTEDGRIISTPRPSAKGGELRQCVASHGYLVVNLCKNGKASRRYVHDVVAEAYIGKKPCGYQVRHINGDRSDCRASNLSYGTQSDNEKDKAVHGTGNQGGRHGMSKLSDSKVEAIKRELRAGYAGVDIAKRYGVSDSTISKILNGIGWRHINAG